MGRRRPSRASTGRILAHPGAVLVAGIAGRQGRWRLHVYLGLASCPSLDSARSQAVAEAAGVGGGGRAYAGYIDRAALSREIPTE